MAQVELFLALQIIWTARGTHTLGGPWNSRYICVSPRDFMIGPLSEVQLGRRIQCLRVSGENKPLILMRCHGRNKLFHMADRHQLHLIENSCLCIWMAYYKSWSFASLLSVLLTCRAHPRLWGGL